jgi:hypothetical protein
LQEDRGVDRALVLAAQVDAAGIVGLDQVVAANDSALAQSLGSLDVAGQAVLAGRGQGELVAVVAQAAIQQVDIELVRRWGGIAGRR